MTDEAVTETSFDAAPAEVWKSLTSPDGIEQWMGEGSVIDDDGELWLRDFVTGEPKEGRVRTFEPERLLEFDWWPEDDPSRTSSVSIVLEPLQPGTRVVVVERPSIAITASVRSARASWEWRTAIVGVSTHARTFSQPIGQPSVLGAC